MNTIRQIEKIERLHKFIKGNCSGDTRALSERLGVSRRTVQYYLQELRELGAIISYDDMQKTYGKLPEDWPRMIKKGFDECFRVLEDYGILIFKWNEDQITVKEVLKAIGRQPLFGHTTGRHGKTMWMCFMKLP